MVNKQELIEAIIMRYGYTKREATKQLDQILDIIAYELPRKGTIKIRGFGTFSIIERKEKIMTNPNTGDKVKVPKRNVVAFIPSAKLKDDIQRYSDMDG